MKEEGEGASDGEDCQSNHHGRLPPNLPKVFSLSLTHSSNLITEPSKEETPDEHAGHVDSLSDRLPREQFRCTRFADWQHLKILSKAGFDGFYQRWFPPQRHSTRSESDHRPIWSRSLSSEVQEMPIDQVRLTSVKSGARHESGEEMFLRTYR